STSGRGSHSQLLCLAGKSGNNAAFFVARPVVVTSSDTDAFSFDSLRAGSLTIAVRYAFRSRKLNRLITPRLAAGGRRDPRGVPPAPSAAPPAPPGPAGLRVAAGPPPALFPPPDA